MNGGELVSEVLLEHGVRFLFTLCGGHISPILVAAEQRGIRVIDTRHEATAVFAADGVSRLTGVPGVAAVTAGPGVTNTLTAIKNAQLAQSPLVLLGGATAGLLRGRGALQDIDQIELMDPHVKAAWTVKRVRDIPRLLTDAFTLAQEGVPGPVFLELPLDVLYDESLVREWFQTKSENAGAFLSMYLRNYLDRRFRGAGSVSIPEPTPPRQRRAADGQIQAAAARLQTARRPLLLAGSQCMLDPATVPDLIAAIEKLGVPTYLSGMARGLLGRSHPLLMRHRRKDALRQADTVILAGVPADFRLGYGRDISSGASLISINRNSSDLKKNRRPDVAAETDPADFLIALALSMNERETGDDWMAALREADESREQEIVTMAGEPAAPINPVALCRALEDAIGDSSVLIGDGGDFVATASYVLRPRAPLCWLDPGPFGTLGVGAGFALAAALCRPDSETWVLYGDGAFGFSLTEFDTFVRHRLPVIAVIGNDACWSQIHRDQVQILGHDTACMLERTNYDAAVVALGGHGLLLRDPEAIQSTLAEARRLARDGRPVVINAWIGRTEFRKGSISV